MEYPEAEQGDFISGIYNYCDRWCERCAMTDRCSQFAMAAVMDAVDGVEVELPEAEPERDASDFWKPFDEGGEGFGEGWDESSDEDDVEDVWLEDDENDESEEESFRRREAEREEDRNHPCSVESMRYLKQVRDWLESNQAELEERGILMEANTEPRRSIHSDEVVERQRDAIEVISWYHFQIHVKLQRALGSRRTEAEMPPDLLVDDDGVPFPSDADGSAKVALVGIDRSLAAWSLLRDRLPDHAEAIFEILVRLDGVRRLAEREFPQARAFKRPGFDS